MIDFEVSEGFYSACGIHQRRRQYETCGICAAREATERREREMERDAKVTVRTVKSAAQQTRNAKHYAHGGLVLTLRQWLEQPAVKALGLTGAGIQSRLNKGWSFEHAITTPRATAQHVRRPG